MSKSALLIILSLFLTTHVKAQEMKHSPIDTVMGQGDMNPYHDFFTGTTYLNSLNTADDIFNMPLGNVTFEPGARTHWHAHSGGQILLIVGGEGRYQEKGKPVQIIKKGDVVKIAPDVIHWHGAGPHTWMSHIYLETNSPHNQVTWLEPVTPEEYKGAFK